MFSYFILSGSAEEAGRPLPKTIPPEVVSACLNFLVCRPMQFEFIQQLLGVLRLKLIMGTCVPKFRSALPKLNVV